MGSGDGSGQRRWMSTSSSRANPRSLLPTLSRDCTAGLSLPTHVLVTAQPTQSSSLPIPGSLASEPRALRLPHGAASRGGLRKETLGHDSGGMWLKDAGTCPQSTGRQC
jgi:hypothetical protein